MTVQPDPHSTDDSDPPGVLVTLAAAAWQAGDKEQAASLCAEALGIDPNHAQALHLKGVIALADGRADDAVALIGRAAEIVPDDARVNADHGVALARAGQTDAALAAYDRAIALSPDPSAVRFNRANLLGALGRLDEAVADYDAVVSAAPDNAPAWANRGSALNALGRLEDAFDSHARVAALAPGSAAAQFNLASALQSLGRLEEAVAAYAEAGSIAPAMAEAHLHRAELLLALARPQEALTVCGQAMAAEPGLFEHPGLWNARGSALLALDRPRPALTAFEQVIAKAPDAPPGHANRAMALRDIGRLDEAIAAFDRALALAPGYLEARCNQAVCQLLAGDLGPGFEGHELRWRIGPGLAEARDFTQPLWLGREDVAGKIVLLHAEQGLGDTLNFCRYAALVAGLAARVVLEVQPALVPLLAGLEGVDRIVARGEPLPPFDLHCPLMSLPTAFGTRLDTIPAAPAYVAAPPDRQSAWAERLGPPRGLRVGVVWAGKPSHHNDRNRSLSLERFVRALPDGIEAFALQDRFSEADEAALAARPDIRRFDGLIADFADTATLAAAMDVVVSVDTSAAHLAAALGRPTWILLPFAPDWRWLLVRDDSPWYPSVRLFRQPEPGDWDSVLDRVRAELERLAAAAGAG